MKVLESVPRISRRLNSHEKEGFARSSNVHASVIALRNSAKKI